MDAEVIGVGEIQNSIKILWGKAAGFYEIRNEHPICCGGCKVVT